MKSIFWSRYTTYGIMAGAFAALALLVSCGGNTMQTTTATTGSVNTIISDPPSSTDFSNIYVTITKVTANFNADAGSGDSGWQTLVDLTGSPKQIDLLSLASTTCVLNQLGVSGGLPAGKYQQIRLYLLANAATSGAAPSPNACGSSSVFNCVVPTGGTPQELQLSSEAQTGIKIPSSQITSGGLTVMAGQAVDLDINFMSDESIVAEGMGAFRLKPVLHAGEVSLQTNVISGSVVDGSGNGIPGAVVFLEQPDPANANIDRVMDSGLTDATGGFEFCPLPAGNYDVVADAMTGSGMSALAYNATVTLAVPVGSSLKIPLIAETGGSVTVGMTTYTTTSGPGTLNGQVTSTTSTTTPPAASSGVEADVALSALQPVGGSSSLIVTVPTFATSTDNIETGAMATGSTTPCATDSSVDCENYMLLVPASNPSVGTFASGGTTYAAPAAIPALYWVNAQAFIPGSNSTTPNDCSPMSLPATFDSSTQQSVYPPPVPATTVPTFSFVGCSAPVM